MSTARVSWWLPRVWAVALALLMLGPALAPGYVLTYDMVWVPDLALRPDFLGVGTGLPRAVPSDAVVAVADEIVPGMLLQKLVLLTCLAVGGWGAVHLAPPGSLAGALVAVSVYQWNPYVAERLLIGHWPVLLAYAVLPWVIHDARSVRARGVLPARLLLLVPLGSLSASAGLLTGVTLLACTLGHGGRRAVAWTSALLLAANAPWVVSGLLHAGEAVTTGLGARVFALGSAGSVPAPLAALGLGGIWNAEVVLPSRTTVAGVVWLLGLLVLVAAGARPWLRGRADAGRLVACWGIGLAVAVATWAGPSAMEWVMSAVPGAAVVRDGSRMLGLCAPALASLAAYGVAAVLRRVDVRAARLGLAAAATLFPVAVLPDAALGLSGRLQAVSYPASYAQTRESVEAQQRQGAEGDLLLLPFTSYRAPDWNDGRKVLDPMGRFLPGDFVANDALSVSRTPVPGEDPRAREVARILSTPGARERSRRLADAGVSLVVVELEAATAPVLRLAGEVILTTERTQLVRLADVEPRRARVIWVVAMAVAWLFFGGAVLLGAVLLVVRRGERARGW